jgi:hypothetical protein
MGKKIIFIIVLFAGLWLVPQVSAQSCGGSVSCCQEVPSDCECFVNGSPIGQCDPDDGGSCGPGDVGTCSCTQWCDTGAGVTIACSGASCVGSCPGGYIAFANSCAGGGGGDGCPCGVNLQGNCRPCEISCTPQSNCPPGWERTSTVISESCNASNLCGSNAWGTGGSPGSAQAVGARYDRSDPGRYLYISGKHRWSKQTDIDGDPEGIYLVAQLSERVKSWLALNKFNI